MTTPIQILLFIGSTLAPAGTHEIVVTSGNETYVFDGSDSGWSEDDSGALRPDDYASPEATLATNTISPSETHDSMGPLTRIAHHDWDAQPIIIFDDAHQLEKNSQGFVYVVRPGDPTQKCYSFLFEQ